MPREIRPPRLIENLMVRLPTKIPFEDRLNEAMDGVGERIATSPPIKAMERLQERLPMIPETRMSTPFGMITTPEVSVPKIVPTRLDERRREALKAAIATDISGVIGYIPVIGDAVADIAEDVFAAKIRQTLNREELDWFMKYDKLGPCTPAMLRAFVKVRG